MKAFSLARWENVNAGCWDGISGAGLRGDGCDFQRWFNVGLEEIGLFQ